MKKLLALAFAGLTSLPAHAVLGVGDLTFDPTVYGELTALYKQTMQLYENAKKQLDGLISIEKTIKEAQEAYEILANTDLKAVAAGMKPNPANTKTLAGLRAEMARIEGSTTQNTAYFRYQLSRIQQLENLELLKKATATNAGQTTGRMNAATATRITAQSAATTAALAAAEEQRRVKDELEREAAAKATADNLDQSQKVYEAIGR